MDGQVRDLQQGLSRAPQLGGVLSLLLINHSAGDDEVAVEPSVPQATSIGGDVALVNTAIGCLGDGVQPEAGAISMRSDDFEASVFGLEVLPHIKGDNCCKIPGEEVLLARLQLPVVYLFQLDETVLGKVLAEPLDCVVGRDCMVDEGNERIC